MSMYMKVLMSVRVSSEQLHCVYMGICSCLCASDCEYVHLSVLVCWMCKHMCVFICKHE